MSEGKHAEPQANDHPRRLTTVTLTAEQFESLYLQPRSSAAKQTVAGRVGNPTPIGVTSFIVGSLPLSMDLMRFQGANVSSATTLLGAFYGVSGIGLFLAAIAEWLIGNTFPSIAFAGFGGFWISYAIILQPDFQIAASFATPDQATSGAAAAAAGSATIQYNSGLGLYFLSWGLLVFVLFVASLRTNVAFAGWFLTLTIAFELIAAGYFDIGHGHASQGLKEIKVAGAFLFVTSLFAIWIDISLIFASVGFPIRIPVIDLSGVIGRERDADEEV